MLDPNALENILKQLIVDSGRLMKQYLINTDYKKRPFVCDAHWSSKLELLQSQIEMLMEASGTTFRESVGRALKKYANRKKHPEENVYKLQQLPAESDFHQAALQYSYALFGETKMEADLFDLTSEICELHEEFYSHTPFQLTPNWYAELGDVGYLLLKLHGHIMKTQLITNSGISP